MAPQANPRLTPARSLHLARLFSRRAYRISWKIATRAAAVALATFALFGFNPQALAATDTWTGASSIYMGDGLWDASNGNWNGNNNPPASGDSLIFGATTSGSPTTLIDTMANGQVNAVGGDTLVGPFTINGITFTSAAPAYTINPTTSGSIGFVLAGNITNSSTHTETINDAITLTSAPSPVFTTTAGGGNLIFGGVISGTGVISATGAGTTTFSGDATGFDGAITQGQGIVMITGSIGSSTAYAGAINDGVNGSNTNSTSMTITNGAAIYAASLTEYSNNTNTLNISGSATTVNLLGALSVNGNTSTGNPSALNFSGGTINAASVGIGKDKNVIATSAFVTAPDNVDGIIMTGGTMNLTGNLTDGGQNSSSNMTVSAGVVTVTGATTVDSNASGRISLLSITGGALYANGGLNLDGFTDTSGAEWDEVLLTSGTLSASGLAFNGDYGTSSAGSSQDEVLATGGAIYIGGNGITSGTGAAAANGQAIRLGSASGATSVLFGASAAFTGTSTIPIILLGGTATFQTADSAGNPNSMTLNDAITSAATAPLVVTGGGGLILGGSSSGFTGPINITSGANLSITGSGSIGSGGTYSGAITDTGTFVYGSSATETLAGVISGGGPIVVNGPGTLNLNNNYTNAGALTINGGTLGVSGTGQLTGGTYAGTITANSGTFSYTSSANQVISGSIAGGGGLNQSGPGLLTIAGSNNYTGNTTVTSGTLAIVPAGYLGATAVTVSNGGTLLLKSGTGNVTIGSPVTVNTGGTLSIVDGSVGTGTLNGSGSVLSLTGTGAGVSATADNLNLDIGHAGVDELLVPNGSITFAASNPMTDINLSVVPSAPLTTLTNIPILAAPNAVLSLTDFSISNPTVTVGSTVYSPSLTLGGLNGDTTLFLNLAVIGSANYYFTGGLSASWATISGTTTNFSVDQNGAVPQQTLPGVNNNVFLTANNAGNNSNYITETLDGNYTINSLDFTGTNTGTSTPAATQGITLASGTATAPLVITGSSGSNDAEGNNYPIGTGVVVQAGSAAHNITANINLGLSQSWEIDNSPSNPLTMSGVIGNAGGSHSLTKTGAGTLILGNSNTYTGGTIVTSGSLVLAQSGGQLANNTALIVNGGTIDLGNDNLVLSSLSDGGVSTGTITTSGSATLTLTSTNSFSGAITDNNSNNPNSSLALLLTGTNVNLSGSSSFTGGTTLENGSLTVASNYALGNPTSPSANAGLLISATGSGTVTAFFTSSNPTIASLSSGTTGTVNVELGNTTNGTPTTLNIVGLTGSDASDGGAEFFGVISDRNTGVGAVGNLNLENGFIALESADTLTGTTTISGSTADLQLANPLALENSTVDYTTTSGTLQFTGAATGASATIGGLTGNGLLPLINTSGVITLIVGNDNITSTFTGGLTGGGSLVKNGNGTFTLAGVNSYTGTTNSGTSSTISVGLLAITGSLGSLGNATGAITADGGSMIINGATIYAASLTSDSGPGSGNGAGSSIVIGGTNPATASTIVLSGALNADGGNGDLNGPISILSGTVSANSATIGRGNVILNFGVITAPVSTPGLDGIYVDGGTLNVATNLSIGSGGEASSSLMRVDAGAVTIGGVTTITNNAVSRFSILNINGGTFTDSDTSGTGILIGANADVSLDAELLVTGGSLNAPEITLGTASASGTGGILEFLALGGTTTLGAGGNGDGFVTGHPTGVVTVALGGTNVTTAPTIAASASWSSSMNMTLTNSGTTGIAPTFLTATGDNITLTGILSGNGGLTAAGTGILTLSGSNSYSGITTLSGGSLNLGNASALGATSAVTFTGGTLQYSSNNTTDLSGSFANSTSAISVDTNGQNVIFATPFAGSNTGGLNVIDSLGGGSLTLTASNTYTGATSIGSGGTLVIASTGGLGNTAITTGSGGTLVAAPSSGGNLSIGSGGASITVNAGGTLAIGNGAIGTTTLSGTGAILTLGGTTVTPSNLSFDLGSTGAAELVLSGGTLSLAASPLDDINIIALSGGSPASLTNIPLLLAPGNSLFLGDFSLDEPTVSIGGFNYTASLALAGGGTELVLDLTGGSSANYYFKGHSGSSWSQPFATDHTGSTAQGGGLNAEANVFLTTDSATNFTNETIDGNYTINSLSFTGTDSSGNTSAANASINLMNGSATAPLVITGSNGFTDTNGNEYAGTGLVDQANSAAHTISANIDLGGNQAWEIDTSNPLTVTGTIGDGTTLDSLTKTGTGTLILENTNTYDGGTTVSAGTLVLGVSDALNPSGSLTVSGTGTLDLFGNSQQVSGLHSGGSTTGVITTSTGSPTLTVDNSSAATFKGDITDNNAVNGATLSLVLAGTSSVTLSGSNSFNGLVTVNSGTLIASSNYALGNPNSISGGLLLSPTTSTVTVEFTSSNPIISSLANVPGNVSSIVLGNDVGAGSPTNLIITGGGDGGGTVYDGTISDLSNIVSTAVGGLTLTGGSLTLAGSNTFTGTTTVDAGATLGLATTGTDGTTYALQDSIVDMVAGSTLNTGTLTGAVIGGLSGSQNLSLPGTFSLTLNTVAASASFSGGINGAVSLVKSGSSAQTLSGSNPYTGTTSVTGGTLTVTNSIGASGSSAGAISVTNAGSVLNLTGATVYASSLSQNSNGSDLYISGSASNVVLTGNLTVNAGGSSSASVTSITGGTLSANAVTVGRDGDNLGGAGAAITAASTVDGLYITGTGTALTVATTLNVGGAGVNSSAQMRMDGGSVTVGSYTQIAAGASGSRWSVLDLNGGTFTDNDTSGIGIQAGGFLDGSGTVNELSELLVRGTAVVNTPEISLGGTNQGDATSEFMALGGTTNIGSGGIARGPGGGGAVPVVLGSGSVSTAPVLTATASWSSSLNMTLANSGTAGGSTAPTFDTSPTGAANTITLSGVLSGAGGINQSGSGSLILSGDDTFTGVAAATGSSGRLVVSGSLSGLTTSASAAAGSHLEVDGLISGNGTATITGFLNGTGTVSNVDVASNGTLGPGRDSLEALQSGTLTATGNVAFTDTTSTLSIRLGVASAADSDQLAITGTGAIAINNATLKLVDSAAFVPQPDLIYVLVNGGAGASGVGSDVFSNAPYPGADVLDSQGNQYAVYYEASSGDTTFDSGNDIDIELVAAIPEPGTWAEILAGIGVLCIWRRSRRRA